MAALQAGEQAEAEKLLEKAGNTPEAENARGVIATQRGDFDTAIRHFEAAGALPEAVKNLRLIKE